MGRSSVDCQPRLIELNASTAASCTYTAPSGAQDQFGDSVSAGVKTLPALSATSGPSNFSCSTPSVSGVCCSAVVLVTP
jgi:hypothetical protein